LCNVTLCLSDERSLAGRPHGYSGYMTAALGTVLTVLLIILVVFALLVMSRRM